MVRKGKKSDSGASSRPEMVAIFAQVFRLAKKYNITVNKQTCTREVKSKHV